MFAFKPKKEEYKLPEESFIWLDEPKPKVHKPDQLPAVEIKTECVSAEENEQTEEDWLDEESWLEALTYKVGDFFDEVGEFFEYHYFVEIVVTALLGTLASVGTVWIITHVSALLLPFEEVEVVCKIAKKFAAVWVGVASCSICLRTIRRIKEGH